MWRARGIILAGAVRARRARGIIRVGAVRMRRARGRVLAVARMTMAPITLLSAWATLMTGLPTLISSALHASAYSAPSAPPITLLPNDVKAVVSRELSGTRGRRGV